ncbi:MAG: NAD-dependent epimerase/dehydratase family protein, partial [Alphaproteobacteria bacterium]|nr:NAD-dependent epimerase/dehydratase family protein [Alphaproteobacteria bacterium]
MAPPADLTLVTGATGFVGSAVARALLARGERVRVLARPNGNRQNLAGLPVEITEGAMEDPRSLARAVAGCRYVYHVAADYRIWVPDPAPMFRANVDGTRDLLTAALDAGVERIVYTSSVATLGLISGGSADEATPSSISEMIGPYKQSKFAAEELVRDLFHQRGLPVVIVNPSTPVGPHDVKPTPTGRLIVEAACGRMPAFVDTGLNIVHVDDVAEGHLAAADKGRIGERYILGGENMALAEI